MDLKDLTKLGDLSGPLELLSKGPKALAAWMEKRTEQRYEEFARSALEGGVFPENAEAMTPEDFLAMVRALELDIEAEKATVYGRLASSIATGKVKGHLKRHFIKFLSELSFGQVDLLRMAWIAKRFDVYPGTGGGRREPKEFLGADSKTSINRLTFERMGMLDEKELSLTGNQFVEACFRSEELKPSSVGFRLWAKGIVHLVCNEMGTPGCDPFLHQLSEGCHRAAIRNPKTAALRGHPTRAMSLGPVMVVLLVENPQKLLAEWTAVEEVMRGADKVLVATTDPTTVLPPEMNGFERIGASKENLDSSVDTVLARFEESGLR
ncbi:hypothetical protein [Stenotrophomonas acidaminiphila]|uniref:hypothetical protein n=1 Tax=Stenotrophomonas acidaminiphila TaxID=128780 RepID=UPI0028ACC7BB|nr:hypothetical protein [Stenotrophomonas acidaminiphila]